jgi:hypothetical protein
MESMQNVHQMNMNMNTGPPSPSPSPSPMQNNSMAGGALSMTDTN